MIIEIAMESTIKLFMNQIHFCMSIKRILLKSNLQITYKLFNWHGIEGKDWLNCLDQRFSTQNTSRPVFQRKKSPRPETEDFHHLQAFLKASFIKKAP